MKAAQEKAQDMLMTSCGKGSLLPTRCADFCGNPLLIGPFYSLLNSIQFCLQLLEVFKLLQHLGHSVIRWKKYEQIHTKTLTFSNLHNFQLFIRHLSCPAPVNFNIRNMFVNDIFLPYLVVENSVAHRNNAQMQQRKVKFKRGRYGSGSETDKPRVFFTGWNIF